MSAVKLCGTLQDMHRALIYNGKQMEFDFTGKIKGIGEITSMYLNRCIRDVDVVSVISSNGCIEVACMIGDRFSTFFIANRDRLNNVIKLNGFELALSDKGQIGVTKYNRIMLIFAAQSVTEEMIRKELGVA